MSLEMAAKRQIVYLWVILVAVLVMLSRVAVLLKWNPTGSSFFDPIGTFLSMTGGGIVVAFAAYLKTRQYSNGVSDWAKRVLCGMQAAAITSVVIGLFQIAEAHLPTGAITVFYILGGLSSFLLEFSSAIASATMGSPFVAIVKSMRFAISRPGLLFLLAVCGYGAILGVVIGVSLFILPGSFVVMMILETLMAIGPVCLSILVGLIVWRQLGVVREQGDNQSNEDSSA